MIFYFTGTGNSLYAAKEVAQAQGEKLISITEEMNGKSGLYEYELKENELLGFVYPVYAWAPPRFVMEFIKRMRIIGTPSYVFSLCTCGGTTGNLTEFLKKALLRKGLKLDASFSIKMPNNYMIGYDLNPEEVVREKTETAVTKLKKINAALSERKRGLVWVDRGKHPFLRTVFKNKIFYNFEFKPNKLFADDKCSRCGFCAKICPKGNIAIKDKPVWGKNCAYCFACINRCPNEAIQYKNETQNKGRYIHPCLKGERKGL